MVMESNRRHTRTHRCGTVTSARLALVSVLVPSLHLALRRSHKARALASSALWGPMTLRSDRRVGDLVGPQRLSHGPPCTFA